MTVITHSRREHFGLRPMDPMKDLAGVADLIEEAFADDLDRSGQSALRELRWLSHLKPVLWWMVSFSPDYSDFLSGFVWEEDSKIVGNITVNRTSAGSRRWLISNVAVAKAYRRQGIARSLMYAAVELVRECNGFSVALQVRADNTSARQLYEELNFKEISGTAYMRLPRIPNLGSKDDLPPFPPGVFFRKRAATNKDTQAAYQLATSSIPITAQREWPLRQSHYRLSSYENSNGFLRRLLGSGPKAHWVVDDGVRLVAMIDVTPGIFDRDHKIRMLVHPDWRDLLEPPLIARALHYLRQWPKRGVAVKHQTDHTAALDVFKAYGFGDKQTLLWMKRDL